MNSVAEGRRTVQAESIRVEGLVQGVGFRPTVWRLAQAHGLSGWVANDGDGVTIHACGEAAALDAFVHQLGSHPPPLARIDRVSRRRTPLPADLPSDFVIAETRHAARPATTGITPDAATCAACRDEVFDPFARRYRYPFANCTHCGPRLAIVEAIPYDRAATTMRGFALCAACAAEYANPADRRFHAQPIACHACGPRAWLERTDGRPIPIDALSTLDAVDAVATLLQRGQVVAVKGLGGWQLACDATQAPAVARLRQRKRRECKPFALMVRDLGVAREHTLIDAAEEALLTSPAAPIVVLARRPQSNVAGAVAPGLATLGLMLPTTPLHHLMLKRLARPVVLTSGNLGDEPQCTGDDEARTRLAGIAEYLLVHDRPIARRVDDSVMRIAAGAPRVLRRARGLAPAPLALPAGFAAAPPLLAMGAELKNSFALLRRTGDATGGHAEVIVSHHIGELANAATSADYRRALGDYEALFEHRPAAVVIDAHPDYRASRRGEEIAAERGLPLVKVQHHHAHIAACLAENGVVLDAPPVLGIALDGIGWGEAGDAGDELWGGEFLRADYRGCTRLASFKPVALLGGEQAMHEPWRNTYAHLMAEMGWPRFAMNFGELELFRYLDAKPRALLDAMLARGVNSPRASSCGRLFDAVAAAAGVCRDAAHYEGQAAIEFEALVERKTLDDEDDELAYPFTIPRLGRKGPYIEPLAMWQALLGDLILDTPVPVIAARFHKGLAITIVRMVEKLAAAAADAGQPFDRVALSGGVFGNVVLLEQLLARLEALGLRVLTHHHVPCHDGGLALGQAAIAAARLLAPPSGAAAFTPETTPCASASPA